MTDFTEEKKLLERWVEGAVWAQEKGLEKNLVGERVEDLLGSPMVTEAEAEKLLKGLLQVRKALFLATWELAERRGKEKPVKPPKPMEIWLNYFPDREPLLSFGMVHETKEAALSHCPPEGQTKLFREVLEESQVTKQQQQQKEKVT